MKLYYTPRSHFARKVRLLADALAIGIELVDVGNVADADPEIFANNPLMRVPTLLDGEKWIIDSDHIAHYLVTHYDPGDKFSVLTDDVNTLNLRAIMNGIMSSEVEILLAKRTGTDVTMHKRFDKHAYAIDKGLDWLEANVSMIPKEPCYTAFHLLSLWDHLEFCDLKRHDHPRLKKRISRFTDLPYVLKSRPR